VFLVPKHRKFIHLTGESRYLSARVIFVDHSFRLNLMENRDSVVERCLCRVTIVICNGKPHLFNRGFGPTFIRDVSGSPNLALPVPFDSGFMCCQI
jgi:hypothetical protein